MEPKDNKKTKLSQFVSKFNKDTKENFDVAKKSYFSAISLKMLITIFSLSLLHGTGQYTISLLLDSMDNFLIVVISMAIVGIILFALCPIWLIQKVKYVGIPLSIIGCFLMFFGVNNIIVSYFGHLLLGIGFGICLAFVLLLFFYVFNMSEKLLFVLMGLFFTYSFSIVGMIKLPDFFFKALLPSLTILLGLVGFILSRKMDIEKQIHSKEKIALSSVFSVFMLFIIYMLNNGVMNSIEFRIHGGTTINQLYYSTYFYLGFIISALVIIIIFSLTRRPFLIMFATYIIVTLVAYEMGILWLLFSEEEITNSLWCSYLDILIGVSSGIGIISCLMFAGKVLGNRLRRVSTLIWGFTLLSYYIGSYFVSIFCANIDLDILFTLMLVLTIICGLAMLVLKYFGYFETRYTKDTPVNELIRNQPKYKIIDPNSVLTPKELAVFELLLEGYTLRQIAGELKQKYDLVNFYYKNIYRKLEVNSKIELLIRYGKNILE